MEYFKTTKEQAIKDIKENINRAKFNYAIWNVFRTKVLTNFAGKRASKRIATALQKELPGLCLVQYTTEHSLCRIIVYKNKTVKSFSKTRKSYDYDNKCTIWLNSKPWDNTEHVFDMDKIIESNTCNELGKDRIIKYKQGLLHIRIWCKENNTILDNRQALYDDMSRYELHYLFTTKK